MGSCWVLKLSCTGAALASLLCYRVLLSKLGRNRGAGLMCCRLRTERAVLSGIKCGRGLGRSRDRTGAIGLSKSKPCPRQTFQREVKPNARLKLSLPVHCLTCHSEVRCWMQNWGGWSWPVPCFNMQEGAGSVHYTGAKYNIPSWGFIWLPTNSSVLFVLFYAFLHLLKS